MNCSVCNKELNKKDNYRKIEGFVVCSHECEGKFYEIRNRVLRNLANIGDRTLI